MLITRVQNMDYPYHKSVRLTLAEMFKNDFPIIFYLGLTPMLTHAGILMAASYTADYVKETYVAKLRRKEKQELFQSIDLTQPEKITESSLEEKSFKRKLHHYGSRLICPSIMLLGFICAHPFNVIACHLHNYRYNVSVPLSINWDILPLDTGGIGFIKNEYGHSGFYRGFLPSLIFTSIVLWDSTIGGKFKDLENED